jgi:hypothetical protein
MFWSDSASQALVNRHGAGARSAIFLNHEAHEEHEGSAAPLVFFVSFVVQVFWAEKSGKFRLMR